MQDIKRKIAAGLSKRSIAKEIGINEATLRKRLKCGNVPLGRFTSDIPANLKAKVAQQVQVSNERFYGITKKYSQKAVYRFAEANNIQHRFNKNKSIAGESWIK
ncbi:hypothetical protein JTB14_029327 [Gonioctena quinquepunctata]|nr:hypothetical protein JTB14_029327 [Gonioctena quinquepunctata]